MSVLPKRQQAPHMHLKGWEETVTYVEYDTVSVLTIVVFVLVDKASWSYLGKVQAVQ